MVSVSILVFVDYGSNITAGLDNVSKQKQKMEENSLGPLCITRSN